MAKRLEVEGLFIEESTLSLSSKLTGTSPLIYLETNNLNRTWQDSKPEWQEGNQLAVYKSGREFDLGTTGNKSSQWPDRDWNRDRRIASPTRWPLGHIASYSIDLLRVTPTSVLTFLSPIFSSLNLRGHCFIGGHCISNSLASISAVSKLCPSSLRRPCSISSPTWL